MWGCVSDHTALRRGAAVNKLARMPLDPSVLAQLTSGGAARLMVSAQMGAVLEADGQKQQLAPGPMALKDVLPLLGTFLPAAHVQKIAGVPRGAFNAKHDRGGLRVQFQAQPFQFLLAFQPEDDAAPAPEPAEEAPAAPQPAPESPPPPSQPAAEVIAPPPGEEHPVELTGNDEQDMLEQIWWQRINPTDQGRTRMDALLTHMVKSGGSDLHITANHIPMMRLHGEMQYFPNQEPIAPRQMYEMLLSIMPRRNREEYEEVFDTDFAYQIPNVARFRCNYFRDRHGPGAVFRQIPEKIPTAEQLGLSEKILELGFLSKGLVLVTGPTGSGKSTTLAALVDYINDNRTDHIITIEDPIEFVHPSKKCLMNQRQVGVHTKAFSHALRAALREDPDIVLVGELRDLETIAIAIETAETGHLVFGTLHTTTAPSTIDRVIDQFPPEQQEQIRVMLSESLKAVISQTLCKKIGGGRVAAMEVLMVDGAVANLIREGKTFQIKSIMQTQKAKGNVMLNDRLGQLVKEGKVEPKEAYLKSVDKESMKQILAGLGHKLDVEEKEK